MKSFPGLKKTAVLQQGMLLQIEQSRTIMICSLESGHSIQYGQVDYLIFNKHENYSDKKQRMEHHFKDQVNSKKSCRTT